MSFSLRVTATWLIPEPSTASSPALLIGTVWTSQHGLHWLGGTVPQAVALRRVGVAEELVLSLTDQQLIALERHRGEDDIEFHLKLQVVLLAPPEGVHPLVEADVRLLVARSRWLELLDQAGTEVGILIRVPTPVADPDLEAPASTSSDDATSLVQATARLRQARAELRDNQWEHCVATCRRVLENLGRLVVLPSATSLTVTAASQRTQDQRWAAIYHDLKSMTSAATHDDTVTNGFTWNRSDAEAILAATAGLLNRYLTGRSGPVSTG